MTPARSGSRLLLLLAQFGKGEQPEKVIPTISQETLAEMVGTTRSRVSYLHESLPQFGFIKCNGGIEIHGSFLNVILHD